MQQMSELEEHQVCEQVQRSMHVNNGMHDVKDNAPRAPVAPTPLNAIAHRPQLKMRVADIASIPGFKPIVQMRAGPALVPLNVCDAALSLHQEMFPGDDLRDDQARKVRAKRRREIDDKLYHAETTYRNTIKAAEEKHEATIHALTLEKEKLEALEDADRNVAAILHARELTVKFGDGRRHAAELKALEEAKKHAKNEKWAAKQAEQAARLEAARREGFEAAKRMRHNDGPHDDDRDNWGGMAEPDHS